jgi:hypothetical protein
MERAQRRDKKYEKLSFNIDTLFSKKDRYFWRFFGCENGDGVIC